MFWKFVFLHIQLFILLSLARHMKNGSSRRGQDFFVSAELKIIITGAVDVIQKIKSQDQDENVPDFGN